MGKKNNLFHLIQSLSPTEKRAFRQVARHQGANKNYLALFEAIAAQTEYDEAAIRAQFAGAAFLNQLHVTKHYLQRMILRSLRHFHHQDSKEGEILDLIREVGILYRKELFDHCHYHLQKAERLARQYEKHTLLALVLDWRRKLWLARRHQAMANEELQAAIAGEQEALERAQELSQIWEWVLCLFDRLNAGEIKNVEDVPLIQSVGPSSPIRMRSLVYYLRQAQAFFDQDLLRAREETPALIQAWESRPDLIEEEPAPYLTALNNHIGLLLQLGDTDAVPEWLEKVKQFPTLYASKRPGPGTIRLWLQSYNVELEYYRDTQQFALGLARVPELLAYLKPYRLHIPAQYGIMLYYQFAYFAYREGHFSQALRYLNTLFRFPAMPARNDLLMFARWLTLILHYELGNFTVLPYSLASTRRYLRQQGPLQPYQRRLLRFFSKVCRAPKTDFPALKRQLHKQLFQDTPPKTITNVQDYLDFEAWLS